MGNGVNGFLSLGFSGTRREIMEATIDQAAHVWMIEYLTKGPEHPHTIEANEEYLFLSARYCQKYYKRGVL